jgi:GH35 family endo-1,4-beta-xylanase
MISNRYRHRQSSADLYVTLPDGKVLANEDIHISQTRHEFLFGCGAFDAVELAGGVVGGSNADDIKIDGSKIDEKRKAVLQQRLDKIFALFNYGTLPFYWGRYESEEGKPDEKRLLAAARYLLERGVTPKGHPLCWHTVCAGWLLKYSNKTILEKQRSRIARELSAFKGFIDIWDVINEAVIMPLFDKYDNAVTRVCKELGRVRMIREVFSAAKETNPGALLILNDFNTSIDYEILIDGCLQAGVPIDAIGIQSHQHQGYWGLEKTQEVLERFSSFGLPLHFTENTIISGDLMPAHITDLNDWQVDDWPTTQEGEERQAREVVELYETLFAHPLVKAVTTWDPDDGKWLGAPSGLLRKDNSEKPVYHALMKKINHEWRTEKNARSDVRGKVSFTGFRGDYTVKTGGFEASFTLNANSGNIKVSLLAATP